MATFELSAHMTVRPGQLEGFKKQAAEIIRLTKEKDTQTLRYDWFLTKDGTECEVRELYTSPQGLIEHKTHIGAARPGTTNTAIPLIQTIPYAKPSTNSGTASAQPQPSIPARCKPSACRHSVEYPSRVKTNNMSNTAARGVNIAMSGVRRPIPEDKAANPKQSPNAMI